MIKRNLLLIFCGILMFLIGFSNIDAKVTCEYENNNSAKFKIIFNENSLDEDNIEFLRKREGFDADYIEQEISSIDFKGDTLCPHTLYYTFQSEGVMLYDEKPSISKSIAEANLEFKQTNKVSCGSGIGMVKQIPKKVPELTSLAITIIQVAVPVILVIMGSIDLFKGITAGKDDEIKKGQQIFIKRLIVAALIFFIVVIVKFIISIVADTNIANMVDCIDCFIDDSSCEEDFSI